MGFSDEKYEKEIGITYKINKSDFVEKILENNFYMLKAIREDNKIEMLKRKAEYDNLIKIWMK